MGTCPVKILKKENGYNDFSIMNSSSHLHQPTYFILWKIPFIDDDFVIMCPSDLIVCDNRGTKGVRLGHMVLREPVSE